ncbi:MAG: hypothetical protein KJ963_09625 [Bacteroidetes bacterium]|nr:hypothetical protein [Bacteroidota bacterium]MBU1423210.1 hypothetical protein [Bacteroidota bacterium]MBU2637322.1 hypothetical protein [Bacteroidota bacterium]
MRYFFVLVAALFLSSTLVAQVHVNLNINLDSQPIWGPAGYDYVEYYYLPDIEVYYYVPQHRYYYYDRGRWRYSSYLPSRYRNFDFYNSYKVVVNEREPYLKHNMYKEKYSSYKGRHDQQPIRDSRDSKYFVNKNHPEHKNWVKQQKHDQGKDKDQNNNRDKNKKNKK